LVAYGSGVVHQSISLEILRLLQLTKGPWDSSINIRQPLIGLDLNFELQLLVLLNCSYACPGQYETSENVNKVMKEISLVLHVLIRLHFSKFDLL